MFAHRQALCYFFATCPIFPSWDASNPTATITLSGDSAKIKGNGAYWSDGSVVITGAGKYVFSGTLDDGNIVVDAYDSSKVFILLDGVELYCSDDACLRVDQADKVFLTLAAGTENRMESGETYTLRLGDTTEEVTLESVVTTLGSSFGFGGARRHGYPPPRRGLSANRGTAQRRACRLFEDALDEDEVDAVETSGTAAHGGGAGRPKGAVVIEFCCLARIDSLASRCGRVYNQASSKERTRPMGGAYVGTREDAAR